MVIRDPQEQRYGEFKPFKLVGVNGVGLNRCSTVVGSESFLVALW